MNKKYSIHVKGNAYYTHLRRLNEKLGNGLNYQQYNKVLADYGLTYYGNSEYTVIDEQLFGLFLLEYGEQLQIEELKY